MKKKISLMILALALIFSITGCSKADTADYNEDTLISYAGAIVSSFSQMTESDFENFESMSDLELNLTLLNSGLPIESDNFLAMIEAWKASETECGEFETCGEFRAEMTSRGISVSTEAEYADKTASIVFAFDEDMNMDSMTVSAHYTTAEILEKAGLNTILGMGTVFIVLIFISFIISLFKYIPVIEAKFKKNKAVEEAEVLKEEPKAEAEEATAKVDDTELVAVITAAIAAAEGTSADGFIVRSIKRRKLNKWS